PRARGRAAPRALAACAGGYGSGRAPEWRGGHWQIPPRPDTQRRPGPHAPHLPGVSRVPPLSAYPALSRDPPVPARPALATSRDAARETPQAGNYPGLVSSDAGRGRAARGGAGRPTAARRPLSAPHARAATAAPEDPGNTSRHPARRGRAA